MIWYKELLTQRLYVIDQLNPAALANTMRRQTGNKNDGKWHGHTP
jgi:hypothetical protein